MRVGEIRSIITSFGKFRVGNCLPGGGPTIAKIQDRPGGDIYWCLDSNGNLLACIENCPAVVVFDSPEQKEPQESSTL